MKSIRLLQIIPLLFCSIFCFSQANFQEIQPCKITDTLYIPFGFSHILTGDSPLIDLQEELELDFHDVKFRRTEFSYAEPNTFRIGSNDYIYTFEENGIKDSCTYSVIVIEKDIEIDVPVFEISNAEVLQDEIFEVEVRVKNLKNALEASFRVEWGNKELEYLNVNILYPGYLGKSANNFGINGFSLITSTSEEHFNTPFSINSPCNFS